MKLFQDDFVKNLPDCYNKEPTSNFAKLMQLFKYDSDQFRETLRELENSLSLDDATGYTLDLYGDMYGQPRAGMTDEQYRYAIRQKMALYMAKGDYNSIINVLSFVVGTPADAFLLEDSETGGNIDVKMFPYDNLQQAGYTVAQAWQILETLLPAGVRSTGFNVSYDITDADVIIASAVTFSESHVLHTVCDFCESIDSDEVTAAAVVTHGETYTLEV